jgi:autophagy-related protein 9
MYATLRYAQELKTSPGTLSSRRWSNASLWKFREFNELHHIFKERMNKSYIPTMEYVKNFENHILSNLARFGAFVFGSFATILILLSIVEIEAFWGRNVIWWISILAGLLALCRAFIPDPTAVYNPKGYMRSIMHYTHYMPKKWREKEHTREVRTEVLHLFENKALIFLREVVSILMIPYVVWKVIGGKTDEICRFFSTFTVNKDGVGYICKFASFDLKDCGNAKYGANSTADKELRSRQGKMEKSLLNFKTHHERWKMDEEGSRMVRNLSHQVGLGNLVDIDLDDDDDKVFDRMASSTIFGEEDDRLSTAISAQQRYYEGKSNE